MNLREGKVGAKEGAAALTGAMLGKLLFPAAALAASGAGNTAWLVGACSAACGAVGFLLTLYVLRDGGDLLDGLRHNLGAAGRVSALALCALMIFNAAGTLSAFYALLKRFVFSETDPMILMGLLTLAAAVPAYMGFECVARTAKCFFAITLALAALVLIFPWKQYDVSRLFPLWGDGPGQTLRSGVSGSLLYLDLIAAAAISGPLHGRKQLRRVGWQAFGLAAGIAVLIYLAAALTFSSGTLRALPSPLYGMASGITLHRSLTRAEDFIVFLWLVCTTAGTALTLYLASNIFCRAAGVTEIRPVVPLMGVAAFSAALLAQTSAAFRVAEGFAARYGFLFMIGPVALSALVAFFRRRRTAARVKAARP